jgi:hypothetical protein
MVTVCARTTLKETQLYQKLLLAQMAPLCMLYACCNTVSLYQLTVRNVFSIALVANVPQL